MIEYDISELFARLGYTWTLKSGRVIVPDEDDVERFLDEAAKHLHNEPVGTRLSVGKMIIEKTATGHDVYVYTGSYQ